MSDNSHSAKWTIMQVDFDLDPNFVMRSKLVVSAKMNGCMYADSIKMAVQTNITSQWQNK